MIPRDAVIAALKRDGKLLNSDLASVAKLATEARDYVVKKSGFALPAI